jgi:hypothetical protein
VRIDAQVIMAELLAARDTDDDALAAYEEAVTLLPTAAWLGTDQASRRARISRWPGMAGATAGVAMRTGAAARAVEALEAGRNVGWIQQLGLRTEPAGLRAVAPDKAARLDELRRLLDSEPAAQWTDPTYRRCAPIDD